MGLISRNLGIQALTAEDPAQPLLPAGVLMESMGLGRSDAGVLVNETQAFRLSTVYSCIKVISEDLASLPFGVYQHLPDGSVREAIENRLYPILHDTPNDNQTSMIFREAFIACILGWGNGYAMIVRDRAGRAVELVLLPPGKTSPAIVDGDLWYITTATKNGDPHPIPAVNMLHVPAISWDGIIGISPLKNCMQAVGLAIAAEKFGAQFFGNGARSTGLFTHPGVLGPEAGENLKKSIREWATGDNALRPVVLEEGLKWEQMTIPPEEAQFLETRKFQRSEIAALYRVPMHMIGDLERSTNNNIEHQSIEYVRNTLRPLAVRIEQEVNRKLVTKTGSQFYSEHDLNELMRGDFASQTAGFETLRNCGVYSANDIRRRLRENPIPDSEGGNIYLAPLNMVSLEQLAKTPAGQAEGDNEQGDPVGDPGDDRDDPASAGDSGQSARVSAEIVRRGRILTAYRPLVRDVVGRAANRGGDAAFAARALYPVLHSLAQALLAMDTGGELLDSQAARLNSIGRELCEAACTWTRETAATAATALTAAAYDRLAALLAV